MIYIKSVEPKNDYTLFLTFSDGRSGVFDVKPYLNGGSFCEELKNPVLFRSVKINDETVQWANGMDLCPDCVHKETRFL
jgi:hypothetical protein